MLIFPSAERSPVEHSVLIIPVLKIPVPMVDVLYSFVDINQRFDQLVFDPFYIRYLNMTSMTIKFVKMSYLKFIIK